MKTMEFLDVLPLSDFDGVPLAATATRALELWSDLTAGVSTRSSLAPKERIDILDECIDLIIPSEDCPAGFVFLGVTVAEFRAALGAAGRAVSERQAWDARFRGEGFEALRAAARARIRRLPKGCLQGLVSFRMAKTGPCVPDAEIPEAVKRLFSAGSAGWRPPRRNPLAVEVTELRGNPWLSLPTRGKRITTGRLDDCGWYVCWEDQRLQPQPILRSVEYREFQLVLPSLETSYFSPHFPVRNLFAHLRVTTFIDSENRRVLLLDEVQSDWVRDCRAKRLGRRAPAQRVYRGQRRSRNAFEVPECPLEAVWLDIAMDVALDLADSFGARIIAWVPAAIQAELNPGLPISAARRLYDQRLPRTLASRIGERGCSGTSIAYPTHARNLLMQYRNGQGWYLVAPDGKTPVFGPVADRASITQLHRIQARPVVELLPAAVLGSRDADGELVCIGMAVRSIE